MEETGYGMDRPGVCQVPEDSGEQRIMEETGYGMDRPGVCQVPEDSGEQRIMEETGCEIIRGAPTTLAVKG